MRGICAWSTATLAIASAALGVFVSGANAAADAGAAAAADSKVVVLTNETFTKFVNEQPLSLVEFYAPWCGHCQALAPNYESAAKELDGNNIKLAKVDCTQEETLCSDQGISGFPTLKVFRNGSPSPYSGSRKSEGIVSYMVKQSLPAVSDVTPLNFEDFVAKDQFVAIAYLDKSDSASMDALKSFAEDARDMFLIGASHDAQLAQAQGVQFPALMAYRKFDDPQARYQAKGKSLTAEEIKTFMFAESLPLMAEVSAENFLSYAMSGSPLGYYFVDPASSTLEEEVQKLREVAREFRGKLNMVWIDATKFSSHGKALNLKGEKWPAFAIQDMQSGAKYPLNELGKDIVGSVRSFAGKFASGKLTPSLKSAPAPKQTGPLIDVVADEFDKYVLDDSRDVLLELFAPWCGHCKRLAPTYEKLAEVYAADPSASKQVRIAKMDGTENDIPPHVDITLAGFPTILLKPAGKGSREFIAYDGDRTLESLVEFVATNGKHKAKVTVPAADDSSTVKHDEL